MNRKFFDITMTIVSASALVLIILAWLTDWLAPRYGYLGAAISLFVMTATCLQSYRANPKRSLLLTTFFCSFICFLMLLTFFNA